MSAAEGVTVGGDGGTVDGSPQEINTAAVAKNRTKAVPKALLTGSSSKVLSLLPWLLGP